MEGGAAPEGYAFSVRRAPLPDALRQDIYRCMCDVYGGDFATNGFGEDQLLRMGEAGAVYAFAKSARQPDGCGSVSVVASAMVAWHGSVGLVGGVCTREEHRRRGLSRRLLSQLLEELYSGADAPRWLILGTGSRSAAAIYASNGFRGLNGSLDGAKGYNPEDEGEWIMLRDAEDPSPSSVEAPNVGFDVGAYFVPGGELRVEALARSHWGAACLLLNMQPAGGKLPKFGIDDGLNAELRLVQAMRDGEPVAVAAHEESGRVFGIAFAGASGGVEMYTVGPPSVAAALADHFRGVGREGGEDAPPP